MEPSTGMSLTAGEDWVERQRRPLGHVFDPLRTPENRESILIDFACGLTWIKVSKKYGCSEPALRKWMLTDPQFKSDYLQAKDFMADFILDRIEQLSEDAANVERYPDLDQNGEVHPKAGEVMPGEKEKHSRIRTAIEGWRIVLEKRAPKRFGTLIKLADADGEKLSVNVTSYAGLDNITRADDPTCIDLDAEEVEPDGAD